MKIKKITDVKNLAGKRVLLRTDFNVPIWHSVIKDEFKILKGLATIKFLLRNKAKVIILTHLGEPTAGKFEAKYSTKPIACNLSEHLNAPVKFVTACVGLKAETAVGRLRAGEALLLENIRFDAGEKENSRCLARDLANMADIYVNDAFGASHRKHASLFAIKKFLPAYSGWLLEQEVLNLNKALHPKKPMVVVLGGAKIGTKIAMIKNLLKTADKLLIGGALANNFLFAHGLEIGTSAYDGNSLSFARKIYDQKIFLPVDVIIAKDKRSRAYLKNVHDVDKSDAIYDIGPKTLSLFSSFIKKSNTILWNGPLGMFEEKRFRHGTLALARVIAARSRGKAFGIAGGGETNEALNMAGIIGHLDWVSTGGGAMLAFLSGEKMPGLDGIVKI